MTGLELASYRVREIRLGRETRYASGVLEVDSEGLAAFVREDARVRSASFDVVRPGEKARVTGIRDVVEPRIKTAGSGQVFPGILGPVAPVGQGRTHRLSGMALVTAVAYEGTVRTGTTSQRSAILDMWGPGADMTPFSSLVNLVMTWTCKTGCRRTRPSGHPARRFSGALRLAETTTELDRTTWRIHIRTPVQRISPPPWSSSLLHRTRNKPSNVAY